MLDGTDIHKGRTQKKIGVIIENSMMWPELTGMEDLLFLSELNRFVSKKEVMSAMERVGLEPDFLFLDEPTNAINQDGVLLARKIILEEAQRGAVVLLSSHVKQDISALCTEVYRMNAGNCREFQGCKNEHGADKDD